MTTLRHTDCKSVNGVLIQEE